MRFFPNLNLALLPFLIDMLKTDKRKEVVNGIICRLLMTQMLGDWPPVIVLVSHIQSFLVKNILQKSSQQTCWDMAFKQFEEMYLGFSTQSKWETSWSEKWKQEVMTELPTHLVLLPHPHSVTCAKYVFSLQDIKCFDTPFCEITCTVDEKYVVRTKY